VALRRGLINFSPFGLDKKRMNALIQVISSPLSIILKRLLQAGKSKIFNTRASMFIFGGGLILLFMTAFDMVSFVMNEGSSSMHALSSALNHRQPQHRRRSNTDHALELDRSTVRFCDALRNRQSQAVSADALRF
jgi:hypothetical protein